ncbi:hypothetical protein KQH54_02700 [bacterium]|nr:hypothetical protein [bacterium]
MTKPLKSISILTNKHIFFYWLPLAFSWVLMSFELPFISAAVTRLPQAELMIASFGIVYSISLVIESPVIGLLSTSTALVSNRSHYFKIRNFTLALVLGTTILHILIGWTPLFDIVVMKWMHAPVEMESYIRIGLRLMVVWSGAIAWRRFLQGILIRYGKTKYVGQGTIVRLTASAGSAFILVLTGSLPGVAVASIGLAFGVLAEALFAHIVSRKTIAEEFSSQSPLEPQSDLTLKSLLEFHWPLAATNLIFLATQPLISAALARGTNPFDDLAVWPVLSSMFFLFRSPTMALPEMVIALYQSNENDKLLRSFSLKTGAALTIFLAVVGFSPLAFIYLNDLIGLPDYLAQLGIPGIHLALALPLSSAVMNFYRGALSAEKHTLPITIATVLDVLGLASVLILGVTFSLPGIPTASIALTFGIFLDATLLYLYYRNRIKA